MIAAAVTENFVKVASKAAVEKPVKFKVRASVTVRRRMKEGLKETIGNQLDAFSDKIGRKIVLELVSTEIDPSKFFFFFLFTFNQVLIQVMKSYT